MWYALAGDAIMLIHFCFIAFALFGSLLLLRWPTSSGTFDALLSAVSVSVVTVTSSGSPSA